MLFLCIMACGTDNINMGKKTITRSRWSFSLNFLPVRGLRFSSGLLTKNCIFHRLLNIFGAVSADNRSPHEWEKIKRK